ncbi:hypothetical protein [Reticulibacter mediterranei]|nr:hypothetical protein [Reticulibacter mediterranei]
MFRKGVKIIESYGFGGFVISLLTYFEFANQSIRALASIGIHVCGDVVALCLFFRAIFWLHDRYLIMNYEFFRIEGEGLLEENGYYTATLVGANHQLTLLDRRKEVLDARIQEIRNNPFTNGFTVPLEKKALN